MKSTAVVTAPDPGVEALIREARRHQRRRYAATGVAVAAVLAAALGAFADYTGSVARGGRARPGRAWRSGLAPPRRYPAASRRASTRPC